MRRRTQFGRYPHARSRAKTFLQNAQINFFFFGAARVPEDANCIHWLSRWRCRTIQVHQTAAEALGISLRPVEILTPDDIEPMFAKIADDHDDGIVRGLGSAQFNWRARVGASALKRIACQ
jgi:hypothetical protein